MLPRDITITLEASSVPTFEALLDLCAEHERALNFRRARAVAAAWRDMNPRAWSEGMAAIA